MLCLLGFFLPSSPAAATAPSSVIADDPTVLELEGLSFLLSFLSAVVPATTLVALRRAPSILSIRTSAFPTRFVGFSAIETSLVRVDGISTPPTRRAILRVHAHRHTGAVKGFALESLVYSTQTGSRGKQQLPVLFRKDTRKGIKEDQGRRYRWRL